MVAIAYLLDRLSGPASRATELRDVRRRLSAQAGPGAASPLEEELALRLRELRVTLADSFGAVAACGRCGAASADGWAGGQCCSAATSDLWNENELAALRLAGTTAADLEAPRGPHQGCAFRGPSGCRVPPRHRPCVCVGYACRELHIELGRRGCWPRYAQLEAEMHTVFERFVACRRERLRTALFRELEAGLTAAAGGHAHQGP